MNITFITGTGRCGSTLVHEILCRNEDVGFISNLDDRCSMLNLRGRFNNILYRHLPRRLSQKGRMRFAPSEAYNLVGKKNAIYSMPYRDLRSDDVTPWQREYFSTFFRERIKVQNKSVFSHKYTGWSRINFFSEIFPDARFIHVVRDGRAVANSFLQMAWWNGYEGPRKWLYGMLADEQLEDWMFRGERFHELAAYAWKILINSYPDEETDVKNKNYIQIRYEDFVENPSQITRNICDFSGISISERFENKIIKEKIYKARKRSHESDLSSSQIDDIERIIESELVRFNYS